MCYKKLTLILLLCFTLTICNLYADNTPAFNELYQKIKAINSGLKDCQAKLNLQFHDVKFYILPNLRFSMSGDYYYKYPDKYKVKLQKTPSFVKKYPHIFNWNFPDPKDFNCKVAGSDTISNIKCYLIEMIPKQPMGDLLKHQIWINKDNLTMIRQIYIYDFDGKIQLDQTYKKINEFWVFDVLKAHCSFPKIKLDASVETKYDQYKFNQNLPDSFFKEEK